MGKGMFESSKYR